MSQYEFNVKSEKTGTTLKVLLGWDAPLQRYFLVIDYEGNDTDICIYSNILDKYAYKHNHSLTYFQSILIKNGINSIDLLNSELSDKLKYDKKHDIMC